jgi:CMP-N-acetylneuraminic acid synthetase
LKVLGYIPARGGSKGLPGKNIRPLGGLPLLAHTIRSARASKSLDRLFVSTDYPAIARVAERHGVPVPWLRPARLARDGSNADDALAYDLERLAREQGYRPDAVLVLQATSPFRTAATIRRAVALHRRSKGRNVVSVTPARSHPNWCFTIDSKGALKRMNDGAFVARQKLPPAFFLDGSIFLASTKSFLRDRTFYKGKVLPLVVPVAEALDIDTLLDFNIAEALLKSRRKTR